MPRSPSRANREDTSVELAEVILLFAALALLAAVGLALVRAGQTAGGTKAYLITLGLVSVALSWGLVHTVFTLRYARSYYSPPVGGIDFQRGRSAHLSGLRLFGVDHRHDLPGIRHELDHQEDP